VGEGGQRGGREKEDVGAGGLVLIAAVALALIGWGGEGARRKRKETEDGPDFHFGKSS